MLVRWWWSVSLSPYIQLPDSRSPAMPHDAGFSELISRLLLCTRCARSRCGRLKWVWRAGPVTNFLRCPGKINHKEIWIIEINFGIYAVFEIYARFVERFISPARQTNGSSQYLKWAKLLTQYFSKVVGVFTRQAHSYRNRSWREHDSDAKSESQKAQKKKDNVVHLNAWLTIYTCCSPAVSPQLRQEVVTKLCVGVEVFAKTATHAQREGDDGKDRVEEAADVAARQPMSEERI